MAGLPPGDPQLVSMIVSHLKTQGLFDQFRRECLADVDTKPAYLNLKQRVDNFVSNHLSNHTWSPHLNKNQLRNNIRQLVLQSGMLEQGVDRIVAQVVDPKVNHIFRPQVERVVCEFLSPGSSSQEPPVPLTPAEIKPEIIVTEQVSSSAPTPTPASDAMSILDTITSLNQEASVRASSETDKGEKSQVPDDSVQPMDENEQDMEVVEEGNSDQDGKPLEETEELKVSTDVPLSEVKMEDVHEQMEVEKDQLIEEVKMEEEESAAQEQMEEKKEKPTSKVSVKVSEENMDDEVMKSNQAKQNARERIKEEYSLEDSDLEGLSDITVSSVHTSDLSSFEEESDDEEQPSDSSEEGELPPDDQGEKAGRKHASGDAGDEDKERKPRRKAYVHKPFLYSRYYSDSDDEITVEERRRSAAKEKEERLLKRQQNRERMEEKRKQKAAQAEEQDIKKQKSSDSAALESPKAKEARKEKKVLEKKMALSRKRKLDSRKDGEILGKKKGDTGEMSKKTEVKPLTFKATQAKLTRNLSESAASDDRHRRTSGSVSEDSCDTKKLLDKNRTHSFILDLEQGSQEALKQRSVGKFDRLPRKELHSKERKEKERSLSDERAKLKQKQEKKSEQPPDESLQKEGTAVKVSAEEKKPKFKSEKKPAGSTKEGKVTEDGGSKEAKKVRGGSVETVKAEKEKVKEKDKIKEKERAKGEKTSIKSDFKQLLRPDSAGSSEDRSDKEPGSDSAKRKDKHSKEGFKRSKSHSEDKLGDKPKSKTDSEKEKSKTDQDGQKLHKSSSDTDKEPKKVKPAEKRLTEKSKTKSKEEAKAQLSLKTDKKVPSPDVKSSGGTGMFKPETSKGRRKDGTAKEQKKVFEEASHEKSDLKGAKNKVEKKVPEKRSDSQEEKTTQREDKLEKSEKSAKSLVSCLSLEMEELPKKQPVLQDVNPDSDLATASFTEDTCDALSDITPEPAEGDAESRPSEVPAEADALLTLMDVCTSAEARLPTRNLQEELTRETELQDADMKMKEAALTLLSMDPDSTVSSNLINQNHDEESPLNLPDPKLMESAAAEEEAQLSPARIKSAPQTELIVIETPSAARQRAAELADQTPNLTDETGNSEEQTEPSETETSEAAASREEEATSDTRQTHLGEEEETKSAEIPAASQSEEKTAAPANEAVAEVAQSETDGVTFGTKGHAAAVVSDPLEQISNISEKPGQTESDVTDAETSLAVSDDAAQEGNQTRTEAAEAESKTVEEQDVKEEEGDQLTMETDVPDKMEEAESESKFFKQISNVSVTDIKEDEKNADLSGKQEAEDGGRSEHHPSHQETAPVKECGETSDEKEDEPSAAETEQKNNVEVKAPQRGRSSRNSEEEEEQLKKSEEIPTRRTRHSGAAAEEETAGNQKKNEADVEDGAENPQKTSEQEVGAEDESAAERPEVGLPSPAPDAEGAGDSPETGDTRKPAVKRRRSEEMEASVEKPEAQQEVTDNAELKPSEEQPADDSGENTGSPSASASDVKEESCNETKLENLEEKQQEEEQEPPPKRPARRGRPPKAAAAEDADKKVNKAYEKDSDPNDDEEEEGERDEEEKDTAIRATTRSASRLEAERNKASKPSTRASRQNVKEETTAGTRGTRAQAAAKGGRKREASPPAVRTRGGPKSEEPPSKRAKR